MPLWLVNNLPFVWLGLAIILTIIEGLTLGLTTIWFALGALISMLLAFLGWSLPVQILVFLIISTVLLIFTRPLVLKKMKLGRVKTNADSLVGQEGVVTAAITPDDKGQVKIRGQIWTARDIADGKLSPGDRVTVKEIAGVTLVVERIAD